MWYGRCVVVAFDLVACNWTVVWDLGGLGNLGNLGACNWTVVYDPSNVMEPCYCLVDPCILVAFGLGSRCCCSGGGWFGVAVLVHGCCGVVLDRPIHNLPVVDRMDVPYLLGLDCSPDQW